ncbi:MAG: hypothetical protein A2Y25_11910 [Candidatus Melainabacteria bacterium GWF2_37_15]|nr:MAG: hypothetical protein A2Y25_11910 [Candidatus Melainabacteria bacterium GWF2_37_15]
MNFVNFEKPIIIMGAARSGTHIVAESIKENLDVLYLGECYDIWKKHLPSSKYDDIPEKALTPNVIEKIKKDFYKMVHNSKNKYWMEKTAANSLRVNLVASVFPEAKFVHIIRDGRDVAISLEKKYKGDVQKISRGGKYNKKSPLANYIYLFNQVLPHKIKRGLDLGYFLKYPDRYMDVLLRTMGIPRMWGPRFIGYEHYFRNYSLLETGAVQWRKSVLSTKNFFNSRRDLDVCEIKYEDLLANPEQTIASVLGFIENDGHKTEEIKHNINSELSKINWRCTLSKEETAKISGHIEYILMSLGYPSSLI